MAYWSEASKFARSHLSAWPWRVVPSILIAVGRYLEFGGRWWQELAPSLIIIIGGFLITGVLEYCFRLIFLAPSFVYGSQQSKITGLEQQLRRAPDEEHRYRQASVDLLAVSE